MLTDDFMSVSKAAEPKTPHKPERKYQHNQEGRKIGQLRPNEFLCPGEVLASHGGNFVLTLQFDGNLVLYRKGRPQATWASNTAGRASAKAIMQLDGNLVVYNSQNQPLWASNTDGNPGASLHLQDNGNLVIYKPQPIWAPRNN